MSVESRTPGVDRRNFLRGVGGASTVAVAAVVTATDAEAYDPGEPELAQRYQPDAEDVQAFYRTNGYETVRK